MRALGDSSALAPFAPYHWLLYGESLWFDVDQGASRARLGSRATRTRRCVIESYEWFLAHRDEVAADRSHHQSPVRLGALKVLRHLP